MAQRDEDEAYRLFKEAAGQGHPLAIQNYESLQRLNPDEKSVPAEESGISDTPPSLDEVQAVQLARRHGLRIDFSGTVDPTAVNHWITPKTYQQRQIDSLDELHADGAPNTEEQFREAERLYFGDGVAVDEAQAITLYRRAARAGHQQATTRLLAIYAAAGIDPPRCTMPNADDEICF